MKSGKLATSLAAALLAGLLTFSGATQASAAEVVPITPEVIAQADSEALAHPLTDREMTEIADQLSEEASTESGLSQDELESLDAELENGELTAWVNGKQLDPGSVQASAPGGIRSISAMSTTAAYVPTTWGACGAFDASTKNVRTFYLNSVPYSYRAIYLKCGTTGWGYRHIKDAHMNDWANKAIYVGANWRDMADFAITDALQHVYSGVYNPTNQTYKYRGVVELRRFDDRTVHTFYPVVAVSAGDYRIITAYPSNVR